MAIAGPAGSGKTWDALQAATVLAGPNGKIAGIDTERGSMSLYAEDFTFDVMELTPKIGYAPKNFVEAIHAAEKAGYDVIVVDSLSHEWEGEGGALQMVDEAAQRARGNSYVAWRDVTPEHRALFDAILQSPCHIIVTMRSKMDYLQKKEGDRTIIEKVGMAPIQRNGAEYEFTLFCDVDVQHTLMVTKSRCKVLDNKTQRMPDAEFWQVFKDWLDTAEPAVEKPVQIPTPDKTKAELVAEAKKYGLETSEATFAFLKTKGFTQFKPGEWDKYIKAFES